MLSISFVTLRGQEKDRSESGDAVTQESRDTTRSAVPDSIRVPIVPIALIGSIERNIGRDNIVTDTAAMWNEYTSLNEFIGSRGGFFVRDLGSVGQFSGLTIRGLDGRSIAFLHDGILLNEPLTGTYNTSWYQTEQIERIEIEQGTRAFLYGFNSTGGAVNLLSKSYKAIKPHSRIRYSESVYEQTFFDGTISQNLTRKLNLTGGVQRYVTDGRFSNSEYDAWGARFKTRFNVSNRLNIFFSENYTQIQVGLFGGVNYSGTAPGSHFDRLQASILSGDSYEKITRHDQQLGLAAELFGDTLNVTTLTAYRSTHLREFRNENNRPNPDTLFIQDNHDIQWQGVKLTQHLELRHQSLDVGGEVQSRQIIESPATGYRAQVNTNAFGKLELQPLDPLQIALYARIDNYMGRTPTSFGADVTMTPTEGLSLFAGYSSSYRFPTFQELYWRTGTIGGPASDPGAEQHQLIEIGARVGLGDIFSLRATYHSRVVTDAVATQRGTFDAPFPSLMFAVRDRVTYRGVEAFSSLRVWHFYGEGSANYLVASENGVETRTIPQWWASGGIYFLGKLFDDYLDLKIGARGRMIGQQDGMEFNPEAMMFVPSMLPPLVFATVVDGFLVAHLGSAYVHFIWQNLFDNDYVVTPFYPMPDRAIRFGISWQLVD